MNISNINSILLTVVLLSVLLYYGKFILLPLTLALFIFVIIKSLSKKLIESTIKIFNIKIYDSASFVSIFFVLRKKKFVLYKKESFSFISLSFIILLFSIVIFLICKFEKKVLLNFIL